jgi:hypothetical protein
MNRPNRLRPILIVGLAIIGIALRVVTVTNLKPAELCGSDFCVFYAGGQLAGTPELYSTSAIQKIELRELGCSTPSARFIRLPYFAALMWPLVQLPFWPAFTLWRLLNVAAIGIFIWLWPAPREWALLACAWSLPLAGCITNGQDIGFLLMWLAIGVRLIKRDAPAKAGLAFAMCAAKFHLFVLLPLLAIGGWRKMLSGLAAGSALLLALCTALQGWGWPGQFLAAATDSRIDPAPNLLFNARGLSHESVPLEIAISLSVVLAALYVFRKGDFWYGISAVLTGGLLLSHHNTGADPALLIPVALTLAVDTRSKFAKLLAIFLVSPPAYFLMMTPSLADVPRISLLALAWLLAWEVRPALRLRIG